MQITLDGVLFVVEFGRLSGDGADLLVIVGSQPDVAEEWVEFSADDLAGCFDTGGELRPAAEALLCRWAAEEVQRRLKP